MAFNPTLGGGRLICQHTFDRGHFTLWADRVPAVHGNVNIFTLWHYVPREGWTRPLGGVSMGEIRAYLSKLPDCTLSQLPARWRRFLRSNCNAGK